jgi:hypothetical protein
MIDPVKSSCVSDFSSRLSERLAPTDACGEPAARASGAAQLAGTSVSTSLRAVTSPMRGRFCTTRAVTAALPAAAILGASLSSACPAAASTYGQLIARNSASPSSPLSTQFDHVPAARSFLLVVTEPAEAQLRFTWSLHCVSSNRRESGGASGAATVSNGHWVKQVRANWIKHPAYCSGSVSGFAASSPVLVRVFAD